MTTLVLGSETVVHHGYATRQGAVRALRTTSRAWLATYCPGRRLDIRVRPNAEWARVGIDKDEYVLVAVPEED